MLYLAHCIPTALAACCLALSTAARSQQPTPKVPSDATTGKWQRYIDGLEPTKAELPILLDQLSQLLEHKDPSLRDDAAYRLLNRWILRDRRVTNAQCSVLAKAWTRNLSIGLNAGAVAQQDEDVLQRSFSALCLASLAERDSEDPFLGAEARGQLITAALHYMRSERDERSYDRTLGWVHSIAHCADLLRQLAKNPELSRQQQVALLDSISHRLQNVRTAFPAGEDDRLAAAIVEVILRKDFATAQLKAWLVTISNLDRPSDVQHGIAFGHNRRLVMQATLVRLLLDERQTLANKDAVELLQQALQGKFQKLR